MLIKACCLSFALNWIIILDLANTKKVLRVTHPMPAYLGHSLSVNCEIFQSTTVRLSVNW